MSENILDQNNGTIRSKSYFKYMIFILMLVQIMDAYSTVFSGAIPSAIAAEFLGAYSIDVQDSLLALSNSIIAVGMFLLFFSQYLSDKLGRKKMLAITVIGMAVSFTGIFFSVNFIMYVAFLFILAFFFYSDIWLIFVNEEVKPNKRAFYSNIVLMVGLAGPIIMVISRFIFVPETGPTFWRGMTIFPIILGIILGITIFFTLKEAKKYKLAKRKPILKKKGFFGDIKSVLRSENKKEIIIILIMSTFYGFSNIFMTLFEKYLDNVGTITQDQVTLIFLLTAFSVLLAYGTNGLLADRIGRRPLIVIWAAILPISVISWVIGATIPSIAVITVFISYPITSIAYWGLIGMLRIVTIELVPTDRRGTGVGMRSLFGTIGSVTGLFLSSLIILFIGLGNTFILFVVFNFAIIPLTIFFIKETKGVKLEEIK